MANQTPDQLQQAHKQMQEALRNGSLRRDLQGRRSADSKQRGQADKEFNFDEFGRKIPKPTFLRPENIEKGENYDVERVLYTTLGQQKGDAPRKITREDIMAFKDNIDLLREQYSKGITIQNIVNLSHADDIDRANEQIHLVVPLSRKDSLVHLLTNAGPKSKVTNHHVEIEFSSFSSLVSSTSQNAVNQVKRWLSGGKIKFECDCERHTYWYRYMATIGGYGLGRKENGYPKLRNPLLSGVACKHVLRAVHWIQSPSGIEYLKKEVKKDRSKQLSVRKKQTDKQILAELDQQISGLNKETKGRIQPNIQKAEKEMIRRAAKVAKEHFAAQGKQAKQVQDAQDRSKYTEWRNSGIVTDEVYQELMRRFK
ncbi:hypothetical protein F994_02435 [Acinetobacter bohemicus ANC 3994]|uniref:SWIM-type domain-containing protein n=1 Tax=Acinetobacter bohemicus ANC 3994 TaxID=1217715 RepID=N8NZJ6_9GAMM|nr:hypothetical protein [Acinetobacter bohemicus]ENU19575.1 hypothetical protein F994_02435 [Acinetobacter bohemicus ANC 3994]